MESTTSFELMAKTNVRCRLYFVQDFTRVLQQFFAQLEISSSQLLVTEALSIDGRRKEEHPKSTVELGFSLNRFFYYEIWE